MYGNCRHCGNVISSSVVNLGNSPLCENFLTLDQTRAMEPYYPLHAVVCEQCWLVQVEAHVSGEAIFGGEYAYFSSYSSSWLQHAEAYVEMATKRFSLDHNSQVVELASNDGYLLQYFIKKEIPSLGIEPAENVAEVAREKNIPTRCQFFGVECAKQLRAEGISADLIVANNVLAHVPDLHDFVGGVKTLLDEAGTATFEFPHLMSLLSLNQFDTIYQEHYCYFSLFAVQQVFAKHQLCIFDIERLKTHGGSLRIFVGHQSENSPPPSPEMEAFLAEEIEFGVTQPEVYSSYSERVIQVKNDLLRFLLEAKRDGKKVAGYGAPGKGNTLLNYCGIRDDLLSFTVDRNPYKHGRFLAGTHIPVHPVEHLEHEKPDFILILPWNLRDEIATQLAYTKAWGAELVVAIPKLEVFR